MTSVSTIIAIALLLCAIGDTLGAKYLLPRMMKKNTLLTFEQEKRVIGLVNASALVFFAAALFIYFLQPFD